MCLTGSTTAGSVSGAALHKIVEWLELNMSSRMSRIPIETRN